MISTRHRESYVYLTHLIIIFSLGEDFGNLNFICTFKFNEKKRKELQCKITGTRSHFESYKLLNG